MKNMNQTAVKDRLNLIRFNRESQPGLANAEAEELISDFLRLVIAKEPEDSSLAAKAKMILKLDFEVKVLNIL